MTRRAPEHPIDDTVAAFYARESADDDSVARLMALTDTADRGQYKATAARRRAVVVSGFLAAAALVFAVTHLTTERTKPGDGGPVATTLAKEIALNHRKQLQVEFSTQRYASLTSMMNKLDFAPRKPRARTCQDSTLLGGRYCSIGSSIACQLKLRSRDGVIHTLYQTRWAKTYAHVANRTVVVDGVRVSFWRERDVLFGLASSVGDKRR